MNCDEAEAKFLEVCRGAFGLQKSNQVPQSVPGIIDLLFISSFIEPTVSQLTTAVPPKRQGYYYEHQLSKDAASRFSALTSVLGKDVWRLKWVVPPTPSPLVVPSSQARAVYGCGASLHLALQVRSGLQRFYAMGLLSFLYWLALRKSNSPYFFQKNPNSPFPSKSSYDHLYYCCRQKWIDYPPYSKKSNELSIECGGALAPYDNSEGYASCYFETKNLLPPLGPKGLNPVYMMDILKPGDKQVQIELAEAFCVAKFWIERTQLGRLWASFFADPEFDTNVVYKPPPSPGDIISHATVNGKSEVVCISSTGCANADLLWGAVFNAGTGVSNGWVAPKSCAYGGGTNSGELVCDLVAGKCFWYFHAPAWMLSPLPGLPDITALTQSPTQNAAEAVLLNASNLLLQTLGSQIGSLG